MMTTSRTSAPTVTHRSSRRVRATAVAGSVLTTTLLWLVARILDVDLDVDQRNGQPPMHVGLPMVVGLTLAVGLLGWGTLAVLERFLRHAITIWTVIAVAVLALSFAPLVSADAAAGTKAVLSLMHLAVAAVLIPMLRRISANSVRRHDHDE